MVGVPPCRPTFPALHRQLSKLLEAEMATRLKNRQQHAFGADPAGRSSGKTKAAALNRRVC